MIQALGYELKPVREVLIGKLNDVMIYKYRHEEKQSFCTCIQIKEDKLQKKILFLLSEHDDLKRNLDYIGHFVYNRQLYLMFHYHEEKLMKNYLGYCGEQFKDRVQIATSLAAACSSTHFPSELLSLLLEEENINLTTAKEVYFNYFIDFTNLKKAMLDKDAGYGRLAEIIFDLLSEGYDKIHEFEDYPSPLKLFYKKMIYSGFHGYSELYSYLQLMPENLEMQPGTLQKLKLFFEKLKAFVNLHKIAIILTGIVLGTTFYCGYEMKNRMGQETLEEKTEEEYEGLYQIGTVEIHKKVRN